MASLLNGLGGTVRGSFFLGGEAVTNKRPDTAATETPLDALQSILTGAAFLYSPNLSWFCLASCLYVIFPYNLQENHDWRETVTHRFLFNHAVILGYVGFWHLAVEWMGWAKRPFAKQRRNYYNSQKVLHNMFYTELGVLQWACTEAAFVHCYTTGKLAFSQDLSTYSALASLGIWSMAVPVVRDVHFYLAHRLIHTRFLYKYIHAVHHRNTDVEPFAGLCMHPCEHLYYFTCYAPLLFVCHHPFVLYWMGLHTVLSPAASHSGYEDHFSSDVYHYCHHRYYECNYAGGIPFDQWFGTYRDTLSGTKEDGDVPRDVKASLWGWPEHFWFQLLAVGLPILLLVFSHDVPLGAKQLAFCVSFLPIALARLFYRGNTPWAPFEKDSHSSQAFHTLGGVVLGILPAYRLISLVLAKKS